MAAKNPEDCPLTDSLSSTISTKGITKDYQLNKEKAVKKKVAAGKRNQELTINHTQGGTKILFQTDSYEILKSSVEKFYSQLAPGLQTSIEADLDENQTETGRRYKIKDKVSGYTVNLYHTTSTVLVNGKGELNFVNNELPLIQEEMSRHSEATDLSNIIKEALEELGHGSEETMDSRCIICKRLCHTRAVLCFDGNHWVHYKCENLTTAEIDQINTPSHTLYRCKSCTMQLAPTVTELVNADTNTDTDRPTEKEQTLQCTTSNPNTAIEVGKVTVEEGPPFKSNADTPTQGAPVQIKTTASITDLTPDTTE